MKKVLVTGCFDLLHIGHTRMLDYARSLGDKLFVAIDDDLKVKKEKGNDRPFNKVLDRKEILLELKSVDNVFIFSSDSDLEEICRLYKPDIRVVGSDWLGKTIVGQKFCKEIVYFDRIGDYSTTKVLNHKEAANDQK